MMWSEVLFGAIILIGLVEWIKKLDSNNKWKKAYKYMPLLLSVAPAVLLGIYNGTWNLGFIALNWLSIFSISTLGHDNIIEIIRDKFKTSV